MIYAAISLSFLQLLSNIFISIQSYINLIEFIAASARKHNEGLKATSAPHQRQFRQLRTSGETLQGPPHFDGEQEKNIAAG
jgi:hypothetical protein